jgi:hypothetical protein
MSKSPSRHIARLKRKLILTEKRKIPTYSSVFIVFVRVPMQ